MNEHIKIDDKVTVRLTNGNEFEGIVKYTPAATGDCWIIHEFKNVYGIKLQRPIIHHVQTFIEIVKY